MVSLVRIENRSVGRCFISQTLRSSGRDVEYPCSPATRPLCGDRVDHVRWFMHVFIPEDSMYGPFTSTTQFGWLLDGQVHLQGGLSTTLCMGGAGTTCYLGWLHGSGGTEHRAPLRNPSPPSTSWSQGGAPQRGTALGLGEPA